MKDVCRLITEDGQQKLVVLSAMSGTTNSLVEIAQYLYGGNKAGADDVIIIHDGIRPLIEPAVLTDVIQKATEYGNAVTSMPYNEQIFVVSEDDETTTTKFIPRETLRRVSTPQAYRFGLLDEKYHEAFGR